VLSGTVRCLSVCLSQVDRDALSFVQLALVSPIVCWYSHGSPERSGNSDEEGTEVVAWTLS